jgi:tetratricopeptide (TPR) repeat protein
MRPNNMPTDLIARLLQQGLDHYGRNEIAEAVRCWQQVLALAPDNPVARDYLDAAGADMNSMASPRREGRDAEIIDFGVARANLAAIDGSSATAISNVQKQSFKAEVAQLLRDKRYESALELLCAARERHPKDPEIARSIELLEARLEARTLRPRPVNTPSVVPARSSRMPTIPSRADTGQALALDGGVAAEDYPTLFKRATEAYMIRDFELAIQLFEKCHRERPDDRRPLYNLNALRRRMRGE